MEATGDCFRVVLSPFQGLQWLWSELVAITVLDNERIEKKRT